MRATRGARLACILAGFAFGVLLGAGAPVWLQLPFAGLAVFLLLLSRPPLEREVRRLVLQRWLDEHLGGGKGD